MIINTKKNWYKQERLLIKSRVSYIRTLLVLRKPLFGFCVMVCRELCSMPLQSFVWRHLVTNCIRPRKSRVMKQETTVKYFFSKIYTKWTSCTTLLSLATSTNWTAPSNITTMTVQFAIVRKQYCKHSKDEVAKW